MNYQKYQEARDAAWRLLIKHNVKSLPVDVLNICEKEGIIVRSFSFARERGIIEAMGLESATVGNDGLAFSLRGKPVILYDDEKTVQRQRFTIAHELGHIINGDVGRKPTCRNREPSDDDSSIETCANIVAARILSPACVLWALQVSSPQEIARLCDISMPAAHWRFQRLQLLYQREQGWLARYGRSCFLQSPLERAVFKNFRKYIRKNK